MTRNFILYKRSELPIVLTGDFNIDVAKQENNDFVEFMQNYLNFKLVTERTQATTLGGSCIDLTFTMNIRASCRRYISYFSYHRPILTLLER